MNKIYLIMNSYCEGQPEVYNVFKDEKNAEEYVHYLEQQQLDCEKPHNKYWIESMELQDGDF